MKNLFIKKDTDVKTNIKTETNTKISKVTKTPKIQKNIQEEKYKVWEITSYKRCSNKFVESNVKEYTLAKLLKELEHDKGYHMRIDPCKKYIVFGDCDCFRGSFSEFANLFIRFMHTHYQIQIKIADISYTINESKPGSYHYSVPKFHASAKKLKEIHQNFFKKHEDIFSYDDQDGKRQIVVDTGIYGTKWFRYPGQTKESVPGTKHQIHGGQMIDFVVEHLPENSTCIDNIEYIPGKKPAKKSIDVSNQNQNQNQTTSISGLNVFSEEDIIKYNELKKISNEEYQINNIDENKTKETDESNKCENDSTPMKLIPCISADPNENVGYIRIATNYSQSLKREIIKRVLDILETYDDRESWLIVGMVLKNESSPDNIYEFFDLWLEWSMRSKAKFDGFDVLKKDWDTRCTYREKGQMYLIDYLINNLLKNHKGCDDKEYQKINSIHTAYKFMNEEKHKYFPNGECIVKKVDSGERSICLDLDEPYCPIIRDVHTDDNVCDDEDKSYRSFIINNHRKANMICSHPNCRGKCIPRNGIPINNDKIFNALFTGNTNIFVTNNNYNNNKWQCDLKYILRDQLEQGYGQIYDDEKLNNIMIESLKGGSYIVNAIMHVFENKLQYVNDSWYHFESRWIRYDNIDKIIVKKFFPLYDRIRKYIKDKITDTENEKIGYNDQLDDLIDEMKDTKKKKKIIEELAINLERNVMFDTNRKLFAFNNGVFDFNQLSFRKITPDDLIATSCGNDYTDTYVDKQKTVETLTGLFPDKTLLDCFLMYLALNICGRYDAEMLLIVQWKSENSRNSKKTMNMITSLFGEYCSTFTVMADIFNPEGRICDKSEKRLITIESGNHFPKNEVQQLVEGKCITIGTKRYPINFSTLCFCDAEPQIDELIINDVAHIRMAKICDNNNLIVNNDLFLLLIEHLKTYTGDDMFKAIKYISPEDADYLVTMQYCKAFEKQFIVKVNGNHYEKSKDVYDKYVGWCGKNNFPRMSKPHFYKYFKQKYKFEKSVKINGVSTTAFNVLFNK
jgi:hypothetical protein